MASSSSTLVTTLAEMSIDKKEITDDGGRKWVQAVVTVSLTPENAVFVDNDPFLMYQTHKGEVRLGSQKLLAACTIPHDMDVPPRLSDDRRSLIVTYKHPVEPAYRRRQPGAKVIEDVNVTGARLLDRVEYIAHEALEAL